MTPSGGEDPTETLPPGADYRAFAARVLIRHQRLSYSRVLRMTYCSCGLVSALCPEDTWARALGIRPPLPEQRREPNRPAPVTTPTSVDDPGDVQ